MFSGTVIYLIFCFFLCPDNIFGEYYDNDIVRLKTIYSINLIIYYLFICYLRIVNIKKLGLNVKI